MKISGSVILSKPFSELTLSFSHETLLVGQKTLKAVCNHIAIGCAHDGVLPNPTASVNKALPGIASGIVENYGDLPAMLAEEPKHPKKIGRKLPHRPRQRRVLHQNPLILPLPTLAIEPEHRLRPSHLCPGHANKMQIHPTLSQRFAQISAIILQHIRRIIAATKKSTDFHNFSN
jgi:hypothetical protein